jgi:hypothetical protein
LAKKWRPRGMEGLVIRVSCLLGTEAHTPKTRPEEPVRGGDEPNQKHPAFGDPTRCRFQKNGQTVVSLAKRSVDPPNGTRCGDGCTQRQSDAGRAGGRGTRLYYLFRVRPGTLGRE